MNFLLSTTSTSIYKNIAKYNRLEVSVLSAEIYASTASTRKTKFFVRFQAISAPLGFTLSNT